MAHFTGDEIKQTLYSGTDLWTNVRSLIKAGSYWYILSGTSGAQLAVKRSADFVSWSDLSFPSTTDEYGIESLGNPYGSIIKDSSNNVYVIAQCFKTGNDTVHVVKWDGANWTKYESTSMASMDGCLGVVDSSGNIHVIVTNGSNIYHNVYNGSWTTWEQVAGYPDGSPYLAGFNIDGSDELKIMFTDYAGDTYLKYTEGVRGSWSAWDTVGIYNANTVSATRMDDGTIHFIAEGPSGIAEYYGSYGSWNNRSIDSLTANDCYYVSVCTYSTTISICFWYYTYGGSPSQHLVSYYATDGSWSDPIYLEEGDSLYGANYISIWDIGTEIKIAFGSQDGSAMYGYNNSPEPGGESEFLPCPASFYKQYNVFKRIRM